MLLSGKKNLNLFYKNKLNFIIDLTSIENPNGTGIFGFENFNFKIINNKLLDPENLFIDTLESGKRIFLSGKLSPTGYSYYLNDNLVALDKQKNLNNINNFFYDFQDGFLNLTDLKFFGNFDGLELFFPEEINVGGLFTGYASNVSNKNLTIKSGFIKSSNNFELNQLDTGIYAPNSSGKIIIQTSGFNQTIPIKAFPLEINLFGDFGSLNKTVSINRYSAPLNYSIFSGSNLTASNINANLGESIIFNNILFYENISGRDIDNQIVYNPKNIELNLIYSSGYTGNHQSYIIGSGVTNVNFSGEITGQGYFSKLINIQATGKNPVNYLNYIDTLTTTGYSDFKIVSGFMENQKTTSLASGIKSGVFSASTIIPVVLQEQKQIKLSNNVLGFGILTGLCSGVGVGNGVSGSGFFYYNTGSYFTGDYNYNYDKINLTGIYDGNADCNYINTGYYSGLFSGLITGTGLLYSDEINYNATGKISGDLNKRILIKNVSNRHKTPHVATGIVNIDVDYQGFGNATGNYVNTNIFGNITQYTGIVNSNYTGSINGTGFLISSGSATLKNKYGEENLINYINFEPYQAVGNPNNVNSQENIVNYNYSCPATGETPFSGLSGIIGYTTPDNIINFTGFINLSGILSGKAENGMYKATGITSNILDGNFFTTTVTGYISNQTMYSLPPTGYSGISYFSGKHMVRLYAKGFSKWDWQLEPRALSGYYNRTPGGSGIYDNIDAIPIPRPYLRWGYIEEEIDLPLTGIQFPPNGFQNEQVALLQITKPYKDFIYVGQDYIAFRVLTRDFQMSPPAPFYINPRPNNTWPAGNGEYQFLVPDNEIDYLTAPPVGRSYYRPNPIIISGEWRDARFFDQNLQPVMSGAWVGINNETSEDAVHFKSIFYDWTLEPKSAFYRVDCLPVHLRTPQYSHDYNGDCGTSGEFTLRGVMELTGSGFMSVQMPASIQTGIIISGSGIKLTKQNLTGIDFDYITGYEKNISKLRTQNIDGYEYSGWDTRTVNRTGNFSIDLDRIVSGFGLSQIEFTYTGRLTGKMENLLINNNSGYLYTGLYLEKPKEEIDLSNFKYINIDNNVYDLNLVPISNLSGSGFGLVPVTGFFSKYSSGIFSNTNIITESGNFLITGSGNINIDVYFPLNSTGVITVNNNYTGLIKNPKILNTNYNINDNSIIGTGRFNQAITGSGYIEKLVYINNASGNILPGNIIYGNYLDIKNIDFYISGNATSGIINYNNIATQYESGVLYSGYLDKVEAVKSYNYNEDILVTGYLNNQLNYQINFDNSYSISTGIYNEITNTIEYKNLDFINGKYHGTGNLPSGINTLYIQTKLKEYKTSNPIKANLEISGNSGTSSSSVINVNYEKPEVS